MNPTVTLLRKHLSEVAPYPPGCSGFENRPMMNGTAFFPGRDGLWKPNPGDAPQFPFGGVLVLGSDFGDVEAYDAQFEQHIAYRQEIEGATWRGLLKLVEVAGIFCNQLFCTNAWPCLREGNQPVKGGIPGARDAAFTSRCVDFFRFTLEVMQPSVVLTLGLAPTGFIAMHAPDELAPWLGAKSWRYVDCMPIGHMGQAAIVPVVHPSMPNRRHRVRAKTLDEEAALVRSVTSVL